MATLSVLYKIGADIAGLEQGVDRAAKSAESLDQSFSSLENKIKAVFTADRLIAFAESLLAYGDTVVRVADRTGMLVSEVQKLDFIAGQSGNTIDDMTSAISQMQNRLSSGDDSAVGALKKLNINFEELRKAGPYQELQMIADAIEKIPNPANQAQLAIDLFGKSGAEILPTLKAHFKELAEAAPVMADSTIQSLDLAGDSIKKFQRTIQVWAAESYNYARGFFDKLVAFGFSFRATIFDSMAAMLEAVAKIPGAKKFIYDLQDTIDSLRQSALWNRDAANGMAMAIDTTTAAVQRAAPAFEVTKQELKGFAKEWADAVKDAQDNAGVLGRNIDLLMMKIQNFTNGMALIRENADRSFPSVTGGRLGIVSGREDLTTGMDRVGPQPIPQKTFESYSKFGEVLKSLKFQFTDLGHLADTVGAGILQGFGNMLSGGISKLVGMGISAIGNGFKALFHIGTEESTKVSPLRDEFFKLQGGLETLNPKILKVTGSLQQVDAIFKAKTVQQYQDAIDAVKKSLEEYDNQTEQAKKDTEAYQKAIDDSAAALHNLNDRLRTVHDITPELGAALETAFNASTPEEYLAALDNINGVLDAQAAKDQFLADTMKEYGLTWKDLGDKAKAAHVAEEADRIGKQFQALIDAGVGVNKVLEAMGPHINDFVHDAIKAGTEIPSSFRSVIEEAIKQGRIFDDNGRAITDVKELGIKFGDTMEIIMKDKVVPAIERLADVLENRLAPAITNLPDKTINIRTHVDTSETPDIPDLPNPEHMAMGGFRHVDRPTLFLAGEAGPEDIAFSGGGRSFDRMGGGGVTVNVAGSVIAERDLLDLVEQGLEDRIRKRLRKARAA